MTDKPLARPRQATVSGSLILAGSIVIVLLAFQQVSTLGSIAAQEAAADLISTPPGDGLGLSVDDVQAILRVMSFVAAATGTAAAILGWQVLQRSRGARLALSVLAPVLLVSGLASGGFSAALVAAAVVMLWVQPSRDWFNGREPVARPERASSTVAPRASTPMSPPAQIPPPAPAQSSWNLPAPGLVGAPVTAFSETASPDGAPPAKHLMQRPGKVTAACIVTIVSSGLVFASVLVSLLYLFASRAAVVAEIEKELASAAYGNISADSVANVMTGFFVVLLVWALVAIALAIATMRRSNGARITLVVSAILSALVSLLGVMVVAPLAFTAAGVLTAVLLLSSDAKVWFAGPR